jgi:hypothetical protein
MQTCSPKKVFIEKGYRGEHHGNKVKFHQMIAAEEMAALKARGEYQGASICPSAEDPCLGLGLCALTGSHSMLTGGL